MPARARRAGAFFLIYIYICICCDAVDRARTQTLTIRIRMCAHMRARARVCMCVSPRAPPPNKMRRDVFGWTCCSRRAAQIVLPAAKCTLTRTPKHKPKSPKLPPPGLRLCVCIYVGFCCCCVCSLYELGVPSHILHACFCIHVVLVGL